MPPLVLRPWPAYACSRGGFAWNLAVVGKWDKLVAQNEPMHRSFMIWGAVSAFLAVALGAFGAHALKEQIPADRLAVRLVERT